MKNKLITSLLVLSLTFSCNLMAFAEEGEGTEPTTTVAGTDEPTTTSVVDPAATPAPTADPGVTPLAATTSPVTGAQAVADVDNPNVVIIDVRTKTNYDKGHLKNSISIPLFSASGVTTGSDDLAKAFTAYVKANASAFNGKDIYILCNSGSRGAAAATTLLQAAETAGTITPTAISTITDGAKDADVKAAFEVNYNFVNGATGVAAVGNNTVAIIDVRSAVKYAAGHLKGSISAPLFDANNTVTTGSDALATAFTSTIKANASALSGKNIYILCNSGKRGAQNATMLLLDAGYDMANIFTITGGAGDTTVASALTYVTDAQAVSVIGNSSYVIIDVRSAEKYAAGHLNGSISLPLFDADNNLPADLATAFSDYVAANASVFSGKTIYILCNSGSRGAQSATSLLLAAGYPANKVLTIEGGAKSTLIQSKFNDNAGSANNTNNTAANNTASTSKVPKTGDASSAMPYVMLMGVAAAAVVLSKKRNNI